MMILSFHYHECCFPAQHLQSSAHLDTFPYRHIRIDSPMQKEQRSMYLVGPKQRTVLMEYIRITPRITVCCSNLAIAISQITFAPVTGLVADTGMRDSCSKNISSRHQILSHIATIGSPDAPYLFRIHERMFCTEFLCSFNDFIRSKQSEAIHVACRELLTKTCRSARLNNVDHIALCCISMLRISGFQRTSGRRTTSVIVHNHRIFSGSVKVRRKVITSIDGISMFRYKIPVLTFTEDYIFHDFLRIIFQTNRLSILYIVQIQAQGVGSTLSPIDDGRRGRSHTRSGGLCRLAHLIMAEIGILNIKTTYHVFLCTQ